MALYFMCFMGGTPVGAPLIGWISEHLGAPWGLILGGAVCVVAGARRGRRPGPRPPGAARGRPRRRPGCGCGWARRGRGGRPPGCARPRRPSAERGAGASRSLGRAESAPGAVSEYRPVSPPRRVGRRRGRARLLQIGGTVAVVAAPCIVAGTGPAAAGWRRAGASERAPTAAPAPRCRRAGRSRSSPPTSAGSRRQLALVPAGCADGPPAGAAGRRLRRRARSRRPSCSRSRTSCGRRRPGTARDVERLRLLADARGRRAGGARLSPRRPAGSSSPSTRRRRRGPTSTARSTRCATRPGRRAGRRPTRWHLTLLFLGAVPRRPRAARWSPRPAPAVAAAPADDACGWPARGRFGSLRRPQVAWAGLDGDVAPLVELAGRLAAAARGAAACRSRTARSGRT